MTVEQAPQYKNGSVKPTVGRHSWQLANCGAHGKVASSGIKGQILSFEPSGGTDSKIYSSKHTQFSYYPSEWRAIKYCLMMSDQTPVCEEITNIVKFLTSTGQSKVRKSWT